MRVNYLFYFIVTQQRTNYYDRKSHDACISQNITAAMKKVRRPLMKNLLVLQYWWFSNGEKFVHFKCILLKQSQNPSTILHLLATLIKWGLYLSITCWSKILNQSLFSAHYLADRSTSDSINGVELLGSQLTFNTHQVTSSYGSASIITADVLLGCGWTEPRSIHIKYFLREMVKLTKKRG